MLEKLEDEGIYIWLDLEVQRGLKRGDEIQNFEEISRGNPATNLKGCNYVNVIIQKAMQHFNEAYVAILTALLDCATEMIRPSIVLMLTNENDVTHHFANSLPFDKVWRSWEPGPSKLFLNDLEHRFDVEMIKQLRSLGVKIPIVTTSSWGRDPLSSLPALTTGNLIIATLPAAALLYRRQDVQEANTSYVFAPTEKQLFNQDISPFGNRARTESLESQKPEPLV